MTIDTSTYRLLGTTGLKVSPLTLGAMMFGKIGNPDHDDSVRIIHRALDAGINIIDTADVYSRGESEEIVGKALKGRRDDVIVATKVHGTMSDDDPNQQGNSRRWIIREVESSLRRLGTDYIDLYQLHRPRPETDIDDTLSALSDLVHAGQGPLHRHHDVPAVAGRGGPVGGRAPAPRAPGDRAGAVLDPRPRGRARPAPDRAEVRPRRAAVEPARGRLALGSVPPRRGVRRTPPAAVSGSPPGTTPSLPENAVKLEAVHQLQDLADQAGVSLVHLALAFVLEHPAVTSAIIGPRTMEHLESQLDVVKVSLAQDVLDRIDEIVPPGTTINEADRGYAPPALDRRVAAAALRLRLTQPRVIRARRSPAGAPGSAACFAHEHRRRLVPRPRRPRPGPLLGRRGLDRRTAPRGPGSRSSPTGSSGTATTSPGPRDRLAVACGLPHRHPGHRPRTPRRKEIDASQGRLGGRGTATAGFVTGLIGTIWSALAALLVIGVFAFGGALTDDCSTVSTSDGGTVTTC